MVLRARPTLRSRLFDVAAAMTTPLLPEDYLTLVDPLWSRTELRARVEDVRQEAAGAVTLVLRPGRTWPGHTAGQWVRLGVFIDGVLHWRSYSLTGPARRDGRIGVTVGAVAGGLVSTHLAASARPGQVLRLAPPSGDFVLPARAPDRLLFVTAGTGLTPVMGMLRELAGRGALPDVVLLHSARTAGDVLFGDELRALAASTPAVRLVERHTRDAGRLDPAGLAADVPDWRQRTAYACGPAGLLDVLEQHWADAGLADRLHIERFAPRVVTTTAGGGTVEFARNGTTADGHGAVSLLETGEAAGVLMPSGCRMGICFGCVVPLLRGSVRDLRTGDVHGEQGDLVQTCISAPAGDLALAV